MLFYTKIPSKLSQRCAWYKYSNYLRLKMIHSNLIPPLGFTIHLAPYKSICWGLAWFFISPTYRTSNVWHTSHSSQGKYRLYNGQSTNCKIFCHRIYSDVSSWKRKTTWCSIGILRMLHLWAMFIADIILILVLSKTFTSLLYNINVVIVDRLNTIWYRESNLFVSLGKLSRNYQVSLIISEKPSFILPPCPSELNKLDQRWIHTYIHTYQSISFRWTFLISINDS